MIRNYICDLKREFRSYNGNKLMRDMMAGLTVCAVALPLALAFGVSSGASAAAGLITAIIGGIIIGLFSGASFQISGPTGAMSAVLVSIVITYQLQGLFVACFLAGILLVLASLLKLGRFMNFIPMPVIMGFTAGIAITIAIGQIDNFFGTTSGGASIIGKAVYFAQNGFHPSYQAVLIGCLVIAVMVAWPKRWNAKVPSSLVAIIVATIGSVLLDFEQLAVVGEIPKTLLLSERLSFSGIDLALLKNLTSPVITIAALAMIESLMCGASASSMKNEPFDSNRELMAQGIGNILLPLFGGVPATAAIARTSVAIKSGAVTRLTGIFHSVFLLISMFFLGGVMAKLPLSALAGVLIVTAWRMIEWDGVRYMFRRSFKGAVSQFLLTMGITVVFDLTVAIAFGVVYSALLYVWASSHLSIHFSDVTSDKLKVDVEGTEAMQHMTVAYITGPMFFANIDQWTNKIAAVPERKFLILSMRGVPHIDISGAQAVLELCQGYKQKGNDVAFCGVCSGVLDYLNRAGVTSVVGADHFYISADKAILDKI